MIGSVIRMAATASAVYFVLLTSDLSLLHGTILAYVAGLAIAGVERPYWKTARDGSE